MAGNTPMMEMTRRYGNTVYEISAYCNPDSKATYDEVLLTLIRQEAEKADSEIQQEDETQTA